jgi:hypothetical protein
LQIPLRHGPLQHGGRPGKHIAPGGRHTPGSQAPLMHARPPQQVAPGKLQPPPGGTHGPPPQTPLVHWFEQHWPGTAHGVPFGWQGPHAIPQKVFTSPTHTWSHVFWQQNGSIAQILETQGSHTGESGGPMTHSGCEHVPIVPQRPPLHCPVQHSMPVLQASPLGRHMNGPH